MGLCAVLLAGYGLLSVTAYLLVQQFELVVVFKELSDRQQGLVAALGALQLNSEGFVGRGKVGWQTEGRFPGQVSQLGKTKFLV